MVCHYLCPGYLPPACHPAVEGGWGWRVPTPWPLREKPSPKSATFGAVDFYGCIFWLSMKIKFFL